MHLLDKTGYGFGMDEMAGTAVSVADVGLGSGRPWGKVTRNAAIIDALARPGATVKGVAEAFDLAPQRVAKIRDRYENSIRAIGKVDRARLIDRLWDFVDRIADSLTDEDIEDTSLKDRLIAMGVAIDKARLMAGEATVIMGSERRRKVEELLPAMVEEARRRGMILDLPASAFSEIKAPGSG